MCSNITITHGIIYKYIIYNACVITIYIKLYICYIFLLHYECIQFDLLLHRAAFKKLFTYYARKFSQVADN